MAKTLNRMGVPSRKDIDALIKRIDELSTKVGGKAAPAKKAAAGKPAAKKATKAPAKRAARKAA